MYINLKSNNWRMTRYQIQAKADRRAAAAERRAELKSTGRNELTERRNLYKVVWSNPNQITKHF